MRIQLDIDMGLKWKQEMDKDNNIMFTKFEVEFGFNLATSQNFLVYDSSEYYLDANEGLAMDEEGINKIKMFFNNLETYNLEK